MRKSTYKSITTIAKENKGTDTFMLTVCVQRIQPPSLLAYPHAHEYAEINYFPYFHVFIIIKFPEIVWSIYYVHKQLIHIIRFTCSTVPHLALRHPLKAVHESGNGNGESHTPAFSVHIHCNFNFNNKTH